MAFTYIGDLSTDLDKLRFEIGDTVSAAGVLPDGSNIPDATLNAVLTQEGSVGLAAARVCESLARAWAKIASSQSVGGRSEANNQVTNWSNQAQELRRQFGQRSGTAAGMFSVGMKRDDGYAEWNPVDTGVASEWQERTVFIQL